MDGQYLGYIHILAIVNKAVMNINVQYLFWVSQFF